MREKWLPVLGWEDRYKVSSRGRVWSIAKKMYLKPVPSEWGHLRVWLCRDRATKCYRVHTLVLEAFVGPRPEGHEACHAPDLNPANNSVENLRWDTSSSNKLDTVRDGNHVQARKTHCPKGHEYSEANTKRVASRPNARYCRECHRAESKQRQQQIRDKMKEN